MIAPSCAPLRTLPSHVQKGNARHGGCWRCPARSRDGSHQRPPAASGTWLHCPGKPASCREPSVGRWESHCGPSAHRAPHWHRPPEVDGTLWAICWPRWSSDFLPISSGVLAPVLCRRTRHRVGHLEQTAVDQPCRMLPDGPLLHAVETFAGEGEEEEFARRHFIDTARAQIDQGVPLELAYDRP